MSPMSSVDRCMNARLYAGTDRPCDGPSYWTLKPILRLCAECFRARFGVDPISNRACDARPTPSASSTVPIHASAGHVAGRDRRPAEAQSRRAVA